MDSLYQFRKMELKDISFFNLVRNESCLYLHDSNRYTIEESEEWFLKHTPVFFIVSHDKNDIGYFRTSNWERDSVYIGMDISCNMRGKGHAQICYPVFMDFLKDVYNINKFYLRVLKSNERAQHIYRKIGFVIIEETEEDLKMELIYDKRKKS